MRLLEFLRSEERVGEIGKEPGGHDAGEPIIEQHCCLLQSVAGVCVSDGSREEAKAKGKQDEVEHWVLLRERTPAELDIRLVAQRRWRSAL